MEPILALKAPFPTAEGVIMELKKGLSGLLFLGLFLCLARSPAFARGSPHCTTETCELPSACGNEDFCPPRQGIVAIVETLCIPDYGGQHGCQENVVCLRGMRSRRG
jgi:hypothetical protein